MSNSSNNFKVSTAFVLETFLGPLPQMMERGTQCHYLERCVSPEIFGCCFTLAAGCGNADPQLV